jgi:arsenate reductase (thioredoxin)
VAAAHMMTKGERMALHSASCDLHAQFRGTFGPRTIEAMLLTSYAQISARATVHRRVTLGAERSARERLRLLAGTWIPAHSTTPQVLFLGTRGADCAQMACGWLTHLAARHRLARQTDPAATRVRPSILTVMAEAGIEFTPEIPHRWADEYLPAAARTPLRGLGHPRPRQPRRAPHPPCPRRDPAARHGPPAQAHRSRARTMRPG